MIATNFPQNSALNIPEHSTLVAPEKSSADLRIVSLEQIDSTNNYIKDAIRQGLPHGLLCRARLQTGGYGRQGRRWESPGGSLFQSVLLRPETPGENLSSFALVVALAIKDGLKDYFSSSLEPVFLDTGLKIKWPNDLLFNGSKVAGISCENLSGALCIGMGVNVVKPEIPISLEDGKTAAFLEDFLECAGQGDKILLANLDILGNVLGQKVLDYFELWEKEGFGYFHAAYEKSDFLVGKTIAISLLTRDNIISGEACGLSPSGNLLLNTANGIQELFSGEVHIINSY